MQHWLKEGALTWVRGDFLAKLPEPERKSWQMFWAEVETLRQPAAKP
jgi:hypothetical protein